MAATLKQIAREVGVNPSTVSRVLNGASGGRISDSVRKRIEDASRRLGYQVNAAAQSLARGATNCVGVLVPDVTDPVLAEYVSRLDTLLREHNLQAIPLISGIGGQRNEWCLRALQRGQVDAVICLTCSDALIDTVCELQDRGYPIVARCVDRPIEEVPFSCVGIDIADAFAVLAEHLHGGGCRTIGFVGGLAVEEAKSGVFRHVGAQHMLAAHQTLGLPMDSTHFVPCSDAATAREAVLKAFDETSRRFDALIVQSGKLLPGVRRALKELRLDIPRDCALACISDSDACRFMDVPVTVWDQPITKICEGLIRLLIARMKGDTTVHHIQYASRLIVRESTRAVAPR